MTCDSSEIRYDIFLPFAQAFLSVAEFTAVDSFSFFPWNIKKFVHHDNIILNNIQKVQIKNFKFFINHVIPCSTERSYFCKAQANIFSQKTFFYNVYVFVAASYFDNSNSPFWYQESEFPKKAILGVKQNKM